MLLREHATGLHMAPRPEITRLTGVFVGTDHTRAAARVAFSCVERAAGPAESRNRRSPGPKSQVIRGSSESTANEMMGGGVPRRAVLQAKGDTCCPSTKTFGLVSSGWATSASPSRVLCAQV